MKTRRKHPRRASLGYLFAFNLALFQPKPPKPLPRYFTKH
jgi:hypothetical protein